jgi:small subunit ribosomal protein S18
MRGGGGGGGRGGPGGGRGGPGGAGGRGGKDAGKRYFFRRRKVCKFCADKIDYIDYKDVKLLSGFVPERGKVLPRRMFGTCAEHQRKLTLAIKRARNIALLPFAAD